MNIYNKFKNRKNNATTSIESKIRTEEQVRENDIDKQIKDIELLEEDYQKSHETIMDDFSSRSQNAIYIVNYDYFLEGINKEDVQSVLDYGDALKRNQEIKEQSSSKSR